MKIYKIHQLFWCSENSGFGIFYMHKHMYIVQARTSHTFIHFRPLSLLISIYFFPSPSVRIAIEQWLATLWPNPWPHFSLNYFIQMKCIIIMVLKFNHTGDFCTRAQPKCNNINKWINKWTKLCTKTHLLFRFSFVL